MNQETASQLVIWCDASVDTENRMAFGAWMTSTMKRPVVRKLSQYLSIDAEIEILTVAIKMNKHGSLFMTDIACMKSYMQRWDYACVRSLREIIDRKNASIRYVPPEHRPEQYRKCHKAAFGRLNIERLLRKR